jgi:hypothetical protein
MASYNEIARQREIKYKYMITLCNSYMNNVV